MEIFVRHAVKTGNLPNCFMTKSYDDRMLYILSGKGKIIFTDKEKDIAANTLCYYPAGTAYLPLSSQTDPLEFITVNFDFVRDFEEISKVLSPVRETDFIPENILCKAQEVRQDIFKTHFVMENVPQFRLLFLEIAQSFQSRGAYGEKIAASILQQICYKIMDKQACVTNTLYNTILQYIENNYGEIRTNQSIAKALCYHEYYLNRIFKSYANKTLHAYIMEVRMKKAAEMLANTEREVGEIAYAIGFANANHFSTKFKQYFGVCPLQYRTNSNRLI